MSGLHGAGGRRGPSYRRLASRIFLRAMTIPVLLATVHAGHALLPENGKPADHKDVRLAGKARPAAISQRLAKSADAAKATLEMVEQGVAALSAATPDLDISTHEILGVPTVLRSTRGLLTGPNPGKKAEQIVRDFVRSHHGAFGLAKAEADEQLKTTASYKNPKNEIQWVTLEQYVGGIPVFQGELRAGVTEKGEIISIANSIAGGLSANTLLQYGPSLSAEDAVVALARDTGIPADKSELIRQTPLEGHPYILFEPTGEVVIAAARQVIFPLGPAASTLGWQVVLHGEKAGYLAVVDAETGDVLWRDNARRSQSQSTTYLFFDAESPAPGTPWFEEPELNPDTVGPQAPPIGMTRHTITFKSKSNPTFDRNLNIDPAEHPLGWVTDSDNITRGNNVVAYRDQYPDDGIDADPFQPGRLTTAYGLARSGSAQPSPDGRNFTFFYRPAPGGTDGPIANPSNPGQFYPSSSNEPYDSGAVTNMFVWANRFHNRLYDLGFTEPARNYQSQNFGRGGQAVDPVRAEAQDFSGTDNANFSLVPDGIPGRMQMYTFVGSTPYRDGALDAHVVLHEMTHGLTARIVGNAFGLPYAGQSGGLQEGWSDIYAMSLATDYPVTRTEAMRDPDLVYPNGGWLVYQFFGENFDNYFYGIRRYPYSTDLRVNPFTFADADPLQYLYTYFRVNAKYPESPLCLSNYGVTEVHNLGEIWASILWQARSHVMKDSKNSGQTFKAGNERMLQILTDGLKLTPLAPTFCDARNAILAAGFAQPALPPNPADPENPTSAQRNEIALWRGFAERGLGYSAVCPGRFDFPENNPPVLVDGRSVYQATRCASPRFRAVETSTPLDFSEKDIVRVDLPQPVIFYGITYNRVWVSKNGYIQFVAPTEEDDPNEVSLEAHFKYPRISVLLHPFQTTSGTITVAYFPDRAVFSWEVLEEGVTLGEEDNLRDFLNFFGVEIGFAGGNFQEQIRLGYGPMLGDNRDVIVKTGITGLSRGGGLCSCFLPFDFATVTCCEPRNDPGVTQYFTEVFFSPENEFDLVPGNPILFTVPREQGWNSDLVEAYDWPVEIREPLIISDDNGNGYADPGETVSFQVPVFNRMARATLSGVFGQLLGVSAGASIEPPPPGSWFYGSIPAGTGKSNEGREYAISIDPSTPCGATIEIDLGILCAQNDYADALGLRFIKRQTVTLRVGPPDYGPAQTFNWPSPVPHGLVSRLYGPSATDIVLSSSVGLKIGQIIRNTSSSELMRITGVFPQQKRITVQRAVGGTSANFLVEGDTLTFHSQPIPDYPMGGLQLPVYVSDEDFPGFGPNVEAGRVRVTIKSLPHERLGDIKITLTSPYGKTITLVQNPPYGTGQNTSNSGLTNVTLDDAGIATVQAFGVAAIPGTYRAASQLSLMRGEDVDGREPLDVANGAPIKPWILTIYDSMSAFSGSIQSWSLEISPAVNNPCAGGGSLVYQHFEAPPTGWDSFVSGPGQSAYWQPADDRGPGRLVLATQPGEGVRVPSWMSPGVPYVPFENQVYRFSAHISRAGQPDPEDQSQIPNLRLRLQARFAQANTAEYFFDTTQFDPSAAPHMWLNAPSTDPNQPTLYRVDFDPLDVPAMTSPDVQEIRGTVENYSIYPNQQGALEIVETSIERYSAPADSEGQVVRTFNAADLTSGIVDTLNFANTNPRDREPLAHPTVSVGTRGVTLDSTMVSGKGVALAAYDFVAPDGNDPVFKPGKMYRVRYHLTSDTPADNNPQVRLRARTIKFGYANKLEIGSAKAAGDRNNLIAAQALPGIGTQNPAKQLAEANGGFYDQYFLPPPILPESQDWRKIRFGIDLVDGVYPVSTSRQSSVSGRFTLDFIEVREFDLR
jgi:hypothetical protein